MKFINKIFSRLQVQNQLEKENCTNLLQEYCRYRPGHTHKGRNQGDGS